MSERFNNQDSHAHSKKKRIYKWKILKDNFDYNAIENSCLLTFSALIVLVLNASNVKCLLI